MSIEEVKNILKNVTFAPSNLDMGWQWDVKLTKIYDGSVVLEKGYSIRTTFMRPDVNTGEVERGYGRWMYVPENISKDGLVKTAWVCAELIVKHELMEAFLYDSTRIFDPHKSLDDLSYNGRTVGEKGEIEEYEKLDSGYYLNKKNGLIYDKIGDKMVQLSDDKKSPTLFEKAENEDQTQETISKNEIKVEKEEPKEEEKSATPSSTEVFHKQNLDNHILEVSDFLDSNFKKDKTDSPTVDKYVIDEKVIYHDKERAVVQLAYRGGRILDYRAEVTYNVSDVKEMVKDLLQRQILADPSEVNQKIQGWGFTEAERMTEKTEDGEEVAYWIYSNPTKRARFIIHSEEDRSLALINNKKDILKVLEGEDYTMENVNRFFK